MYKTYFDLLKAMTYGFSKDDNFKIEVDNIIKKYPIIKEVTQEKLNKNYNSIYEEIKTSVVNNLFNLNHKIINNKKHINAVCKWSMFDKEYLIKHNLIEL